MIELEVHGCSRNIHIILNVFIHARADGTAAATAVLAAPLFGALASFFNSASCSQSLQVVLLQIRNKHCDNRPCFDHTI